MKKVYVGVIYFTHGGDSLVAGVYNTREQAIYNVEKYIKETNSKFFRNYEIVDRYLYDI